MLIISREHEPGVRLKLDSAALFGVDVRELTPGAVAVLDGEATGFPVRSTENIPPGDYYVQAILNVYTQFHRKDGRVIWAHMDQWEGQQFNESPGNLYSQVKKLHVDASRNLAITLRLAEVIPPLEIPADTVWLKRVKIQSKLLTDFWGHPMYLGAVVLLPREYTSRPDTHFPVVYKQGHFSESRPFDFRTDDPPEKPEDRRHRENLGYETGHEFYKSWISRDFPQMIAVTFQHPTPYYDNSLAVNSANSGPYGDAIMTELIPYIEEHFRIIRQPYARVLTGRSNGGWNSLALQLYHPEFFGGSWVFCPAPIDFRRYYGLLNIYEDDNAFISPHGDEWLREWLSPERYYLRTEEGQPIYTLRQVSQMEEVAGVSDASDAVFSQVGDDGYPKPLFNKVTGKVDHEVASYMRDHGYDLRYFAEKHWSTIGPQIVGKLHFYVGDMDTVYLNVGVYLMEDFLKNTTPYYGGSFEYGRPMKGHDWQGMTNAELIRLMAAQITKNSPKGASTAWKDE